MIFNISNQSKYAKLYIKMVETLLMRNKTKASTKEIYGSAEGHHIIPVSFNLGGEKDKTNIVFCSPREHFVLHLLLTKMFDDEKKYKMMKAVTRFAQNGNCQNRKLNSWEYNKLRLIAKDAASGKNSPMFGKPGTTLNKKCYNNGINNIFLAEFDEIPAGFCVGSKMKNQIGITNGIENAMITEGELIPDGWNLGSYTKGNPSKLKNRVIGKYDETRIAAAKKGSENRMYITDGISDKKISILLEIPNGWIRGRTNTGLNREKYKCDLCDIWLDIGNLSKHKKSHQ